MEDKVEKLKTALCTAKAVASFFKDELDDGTANFDHPLLFKPDGMTKKQILEAFEKALIHCEIETTGIWKNWIHIYGVVDGQGNRRTTMAEKFSEALEKQGFKSCVYYQMD